VVRSVLEAIGYTYGHVVTPELPVRAYYNIFQQKALASSTVAVPKMMFTIFNGGKALGSKVKFSKFYLMMNLKAADHSIDAQEVYYKVSAAIEKAVGGHKAAAAFKANSTGAFFNANETVNESFKILEDAISAAGVNTADRKYLTIGINADSSSVYLQEQDRYDIEGPKNLFDQTMLADWFVKMAQDHPLLTYIEDAFADGDILGYQKILRRFKDTQVKVGIKNWFGSDLKQIMKHTQLIQKDDESEQEEADEEKKTEEEEAAAAEEEARKAEEEAKKAEEAAKAKGAKGKAKEEVKEVLNTARDEENDPNKDKFVPDVIHFDRSKHASTQALLDLVGYQMFLKEEEKFSIMIDDCTFDSRQGEIVDLCFATGITYLNLKGIAKPERAAKVDKFQEILESLRYVDVARESIGSPNLSLGSVPVS